MRKKRFFPLFAWLPALCLPLLLSGCRPNVVVASKSFTEGVILGEMVAGQARSTGTSVGHKSRLGDTLIVWNALLAGEVDVYCDYTGTLTGEILSRENLREEDLPAVLERHGLRMSRPLGFNNTYALAMKRTRAEALGIRTISDLRRHPDLHLVLSNPFLNRADGWQGLKAHYDLPFETRPGVEHDLVYQALDAAQDSSKPAVVADIYMTDAKIHTSDLLVLVDDRHYFPSYKAVMIYRADLADREPAVVAALKQLEGKVDEATMIDLNARVERDHVSEAQAAAEFLRTRLGTKVTVASDTLVDRLLVTTQEHLLLVGVSLYMAIMLAIPLGVLAARNSFLAWVILTVVGIVQTVPGLAMLALLVWLTGKLGPVPVIIALTCYGLLPIVRNTYAGLHDIPLPVRESAAAMGLSEWARLRLIEFPLAARSILAGVKTAAVINVGYATLGGLLGAGGYGSPILAGLNKRDPALLLEGAIPAVLLALLVQGLFDLAERWLVSPGLRLKAVGTGEK